MNPRNWFSAILFFILYLNIFQGHCNNCFAQTIIFFQGGEGTPSDNWSYTSSGASGSAVGYATYAANRKTGNTSLVVGGNTGCGDCISGCCSGNGTATQRIFTFSNVDISTCSAPITLTFNYGNYSPSCAGNGWDAGENLLLTPYLNGLSQSPITIVSGTGDLHRSVPSTQYSYTIPAGTTSFYFTLSITTNRADELLFLDDVTLSCNILLPLQLLSFTANYNAPFVKLNWVTATEDNTDHFEVQRSNDGESFYSIASVKAAGYSYQLLDYYFNDESPLQGNNYYRLKTVDANGDSTFSSLDEVSVPVNHSQLSFRLYPLAATDVINIILLNASTQYFGLAIYNSVGEQIMQESFISGENSTVHSISIQQLPQGIYLLRLQSATASATLPFYKP